MDEIKIILKSGKEINLEVEGYNNFINELLVEEKFNAKVNFQRESDFILNLNEIALIYRVKDGN